VKPAIFRDRVHAGQALAKALMKYADRDDVIVLALPRGGVPVAFQVAERIHAPLDVLVVRKLGLPGWEELAMGAIASGGVRVMNPKVVRAYNVSEAEIEAVAAQQLKELHRREQAYRGHAGTPDIKSKIVILIDDGIATGSTIRAAVQALRQQHPKQIIIAVPTAAADTCSALSPMVDEFVALMKPEYFNSVGQWYEDFGQTTDEEVTQLLAEAGARELAHQN
jgi:putative phosphoribosyl transferase